MLIDIEKESIDYVGGNGFLMVATRSKSYFYSAIELIDSIDEHYKGDDYKSILFTEKEFVQEDPSVLEYFDYVVVGGPSNVRTKMWACAHSPFDTTAYLDVDMQCQHEDISNIFNQLKDNDIIFTKVLAYTGAQYNIIKKDLWENNKEEYVANGVPRGMLYHGGIYVYKTTETMKNFMYEWYCNFWIQRTTKYKTSKDYTENYCEGVHHWDQFTLWRLLFSEQFNYNKKIKISVFDDHVRWNKNVYAKDDEYKDPVILYHFVLPDYAREVKIERKSDLDIPRTEGLYYYAE